MQKLARRAIEDSHAPVESFGDRLSLCYIFEGSVDDFSPDSSRVHPRNMAFFEPLDA
jgi:hypothetical protein